MRDLLLWINPSSNLMRSGLERRDREKSLRLEREAAGGGGGSPDPGCLPLILKAGELPRVSKSRCQPGGRSQWLRVAL